MQWFRKRSAICNKKKEIIGNTKKYKYIEEPEYLSKANSCLTSQKNSRHFMESEALLPFVQQFAKDIEKGNAF
jgi:hypothetical protein